MIDNGDTPASNHIDGTEIIFEAQPVSRGIAIGRIVCLFGNSRQYYRTYVRKTEIPNEIKRFQTAHSRVERQIKRMGAAATDSPAFPSIFDVHLAILRDASFIEKIENAIRDGSVNAEWAVKLVADKYVSKYKAISDEYFRDRYIDVEDVAEQILTALGGGKQPLRLADDAVIAAKELRPSTLAEISKEKPLALMSENGGWTSHTFILARELELPSVTGVRKLMRRVKNNDRVIIDGFSGTVILNPTQSSIKKYQNRVSAVSVDSRLKREEISDSPIKTLDGTEIVIRANFDILASFKRAKRLGAHGIGLFRSEYLFNRFKGFPSESEQVRAYSEIAEYAGEGRARIRTFDLGVDQLLDHAYHREKNPALGLRGIRLGFTMQKHLRTQLRALLQASHQNEIDIIVPMVSGPDEVRTVKDIIKTEALALASKGIPVGNPRIGAMIEVPSAVFEIENILDETDCLCLGTNDLVQYLLAADRDNETVSNWFRSLHPAVLKALKTVFEASGRKRKPVVVCGEIAASPFYVPILLGLGAREVSMNVNSILRIRKVISGIAIEECRELTHLAFECRTASEVETGIEQFIQTRWAHLFPEDFLKGRQN